MRLKLIIGVLALLLLMVGTASAAITFPITNHNIYEGSIPAGASIKIDVTYDGEANTITYVDRSNGLTDPRITWVAYNIDKDADTITGYTEWGLLPDDSGEMNKGVVTVWTDKKNFGAIGDFDNFYRVYAVKNPKPQNQFRTVVIQLPLDSGIFDFDGTIGPNRNGYEVGVHFVCNEFSGFVAGSVPDEPDEPDVPIPEFPSVALPVAAILGLMFIFGRRKQE